MHYACMYIYATRTKYNYNAYEKAVNVRIAIFNNLITAYLELSYLLQECAVLPRNSTGKHSTLNKLNIHIEVACICFTHYCSIVS